MKKVALILMPGMERLAPHVGAQYRWHQLVCQGILPRPHLIVGCSAGAVSGAICQPWTENNFQITAGALKDLKTGQIASMPWWTEAMALLTIGTILMPIADFGQKWTRNKKTLVRLGEVALTLGLGSLFVYRFLTKECIFSNDPLRGLFMNRLDFQGIFDSEIKLEILATDLETGKEAVFTNYRPEDKDRRRFVEAILASSRLPGYMPLSFIDGRVLGDAGILSYIPIHRAIKHDCDIVVIFSYTGLEPEHEKAPWSWPKDLIRASDITNTEVIRLTLENHLLRKQLGRKLPDLFIVTCSENLPKTSFRSFSSTTMTEGMDIGWRAVQDNLPKLQQLFI